MKKICFIANGGKTLLYDQVANKLKKSEIDIYWIVTNFKQSKFLKSNYNESKVLYTPISIIDDYDRIANKYSYELKINELILYDRALKFDLEKGKKFLISFLVTAKKFILENQISFVFGELTYAHEVGLFRMIQQIDNTSFIVPQRIRIPSNRFAFFSDEYQSKIIKTGGCLKSKDKDIVLEKPDYIELTKKRISKSFSTMSRIKKIYNLIFRVNYDSNDPIHYKKGKYRFLVPIKKEINREQLKFVKFTKKFDYKNTKYFLYTLHKQPEASIDNIGRYYEDQELIIRNIWRILPNNFQLVIKEHVVGIGDRQIQFYRNIKSLPGTILIDRNFNSHSLLINSQAVFTISGTIAFEAGLQGIPAFVFAPVFFDFSTVKQISFNEFRSINNWVDYVNQIKSNLDLEHDKKIKKEIMENSFKGLVSDPNNDIRAISSENIDDLVQGFISIINN